MTARIKAIIHIGSGKTGTTSIQKFCHENRVLLKNNGLHYLSTVGYTNHIMLPKYCLGDSMVAKVPYFHANGIFTRLDKDEFDSSVRMRLKEELRKIKDGSTILISSEHFSTDLRDRDELIKLKILLEENQVYVDLVVYCIREQADYIYSFFYTQVVMGLANSKKPTIPEDPVNNHLNYYFIAKMWDEVFPDANLKILKYDSLIKQGLLQSFFSGIGFPLNINEPRVRDNSSLGFSSIQFAIDVEVYSKTRKEYKGLSFSNPAFREYAVNVLRKSFKNDEKFMASQIDKDKSKKVFSKLNSRLESEFMDEGLNFNYKSKLSSDYIYIKNKECFLEMFLFQASNRNILGE